VLTDVTSNHTGTDDVIVDDAVVDDVMCSGSSSNISDTDSRSSSTAVAGGGCSSSSRKRSRKDTASGKSSQDCRRLSQRIAHALRKPKLNGSDGETVGREDTKDEAETAT